MKFKIFNGKSEYIVTLSQLKSSIRQGRKGQSAYPSRQGSRLVYKDLKTGNIKMYIQFLGMA